MFSLHCVFTVILHHAPILKWGLKLLALKFSYENRSNKQAMKITVKCCKNESRNRREAVLRGDTVGCVQRVVPMDVMMNFCISNMDYAQLTQSCDTAGSAECMCGLLCYTSV